MLEQKLFKRKQRLKRDGNVKQLAEVVKELGDLYFESQRFEKAIEEYEEQLNVCECLNDKLGQAVAHRMIGECYTNLEEYDEAVKHDNLYLEGAKEVKNKLEQQRAYATLGYTYFCQAESLTEDSEKKVILDHAIKALSKAIHLCDKLDDKDIPYKEKMTMRARAFLNLGNVMVAQKELDKGVDLLKKAAELCEKHDLTEDLHRVRIALGTFYERQGDNDRALELYGKAAIGSPELKADALLVKAELYLKLGDCYAARKILIQVYKMKQLPKKTEAQVERLLRIAVTLCRGEDSLDMETDNEERLKTYEMLGDVYVTVRALDKAIESYRQMLYCAEITQSDRLGPALISLAETLREAGRSSEAVDFACKELQLQTIAKERCKSSLFLAVMLVESDPPKDLKIKDIYESAYSLAKECQSVSLQVQALKEYLCFLESNSAGEDEINRVKELLSELPEVIEVDSQDPAKEEEDQVIGGDIVLEDLSDLEDNSRKSDDSRRSANRRAKRGIAVKRNQMGETQLHVACINGNIEAVEKLLSQGHPVNVRDNNGWSPLHEACNHGYLEIAEILVKAGANVNDPGGSGCDGITPMHDAAANGHFSVVYYLIEAGANIKALTKKGESVLDYLATSHTSDTVQQTEYELLYKKLKSLVPSTSKHKQRNSDGKRHSYNELIDLEEERERAVSPERVSGAEVYRREMLRMKGPSKAVHYEPTTSAPKITAPLLDSEEVLEDEWLDDDIINPTAKKKKSFDVLTNKRKTKSSNTSQEQKKKRQRLESSESEQSDIVIDLDNDERSRASEEDDIEEVVRSRRPVKQSSLFSAGFTTEAQSRTPSPVFPSLPVQRTMAKNYPEIINLTVKVRNKTISLKLKFADIQKKSVNELCKDVAKKFNSETGCNVVLSLMTKDGNTLPPDEPLRLDLITKDLHLTSDVTDLQIPSIIERYRTICITHKIDVEDYMIKSLKTCDNTSAFRLRANQVTDDELEPLIKTLAYQSNLQVLYLSGGALYLFGDKLNGMLRELTNLQELHLSGCDIDYEFLNSIESLPVQLRVLDLSYNPLGPMSERKLHELLEPLNFLQSLNLRYCQLKEFKKDYVNHNLNSLDVSHNNLGAHGICHFIQRQMLSLCLSNTLLPGDSLLDKITRKVSLSTVDTLELSICNLNDWDIKSILDNTPKLTKIVLKGNQNITNTSVDRLLSKKPTLTFIDVSGCSEVNEPPDPDTTIENPSVCTLIVSMMNVHNLWRRLWRGRAMLTQLPHNVIIFSPN